MRIGSKEFDFIHNTYCMGILNVTLDSFSDGGRYLDRNKAVQFVSQMISDGAEIIDVGGESTRPGYTPVSAEEEMRRILPAISAIKERFNIPVSVDTHKARVAKAAVYEGADMINDVYGSVFDTEMSEVASATQKPFVLSHGYAPGFTLGDKPKNPKDALRLMEEDFYNIINTIKKAGVKQAQIIIDPGVGFLKGTEVDLAIMANLGEFAQMGYPVMLGASRKSVIGNTLQLPVNDRIEGTIATSVIAALNNVAIVRVHDVKENVRAIKMVGAVKAYV